MRLKLEDFKKFKLKKSQIIFGKEGGTPTGGGHRSYVNSEGCTVSYDYANDCKGTDGMILYCGRTNETKNCPS